MMSKKLLVSLGVVGGLALLTGGMAHAESLEEALKAYLANPKFDFLGHEFERILFENIQKVSTGDLNDAEIIEKLKFMIEDIKTLPLQLKCLDKIMKQNAPIYATLSGIAGLKMALGAEGFGYLTLKIIRMIFR